MRPRCPKPPCHGQCRGPWCSSSPCPGLPDRHFPDRRSGWRHRHCRATCRSCGHRLSGQRFPRHPYPCGQRFRASWPQWPTDRTDRSHLRGSHRSSPSAPQPAGSPATWHPSHRHNGCRRASATPARHPSRYLFQGARCPRGRTRSRRSSDRPPHRQWCLRRKSGRPTKACCRISS